MAYLGSGAAALAAVPAGLGSFTGTAEARTLSEFKLATRSS
ncbi:hypothetical protein [Paenibacillus dendritiformis]|nr:hypothetical protein [Paenibacillus dendritiformis]